MRQQLGSVLSQARARFDEQRVLSLAQVRAQLGAADRGAALVTAPGKVRVVDPERDSMRRVERHFGAG